MNFNEYQEKAVTTAVYMSKVVEESPNLPDNVYGMLAISYVGLGLGEAGELQNKLKKIIRDKAGYISNDDKTDILNEIGDVLWYCSALCDLLNVKMDDVAQANIDKLFSRKERGVINGSGDNR